MQTYDLDDQKKGTLKASFSEKDFSGNGMDQAENFFNRELSWLDFNLRVIDEASDPNNPYLEQLNFLSIASSNADEFFMVRVAGVYDQYLAGVEIAENKTQMSPEALLKTIAKKHQHNTQVQYHRYQNLIQDLAKLGYAVKTYPDLTPEEQAQAGRYFQDMILPTLSPLGIDAYRPFPHLINKALNIFVSLTKGGEDRQAIVPLPALLDRFTLLEGEGQGAQSLVLIEDLVMAHLDQLFTGAEINYAYPFRITRSADFDIIEDDASDLMAVIQDYVDKRRNGAAIRMEIDQRQVTDFNPDHFTFLLDSLELQERNVYYIDGPLDLTYLGELIDHLAPDYPELSYPPFKPYLNPKHLGEALYQSIQEGDLFFNHPYHSFDPVVSLIDHASRDPQTIAIKMTLYRVSKDSPIIQALRQAAIQGKEVTVLVELKARFDESNNVHWAQALEEAGVHVLYGISELKTHSKIALVVRKEEDSIQRYLHLGTGNYNDKTAKGYTDMGIMSCHPDLTQDGADFFNFLSGYTDVPDYKQLHVSPFAIRDALLDSIDDEIRDHQVHGQGRIIAKMNSLTDKKLIIKLYEASQAGVQVDLIVRGICCLKPGVPGLSDHIQVRSIVGRFLEHSRIYYFHRNGQHQLFLSSADMMTRNMVKRVEIEFPILDPGIRSAILHILDLQLADTLKARILQANGNYIRPKISEDQPPLNSQDAQMAEANAKKIILRAAGRQAGPVRSWIQRLLKRIRQ